MVAVSESFAVPLVPAAAWTTTSTPFTAAAIDDSSPRSPNTISTPNLFRAPTLDCLRARARTGYPSSTRRFASLFPRKPVAPVTSTLVCFVTTYGYCFQSGGARSGHRDTLSIGHGNLRCTHYLRCPPL